MANLGQLTAAVLHASQENNMALAQLKFDFALIKCEPPEEYRGIGECLSAKRKETAEDGSLHRTARQLGALFESEIPDIPNLIRAYGQRATEIVRMSELNPRAKTMYGAFSDHIGVDGTSIWATATSGEKSIAIHLMACMIARVWKQPEAVAIWSELVSQRQVALRERVQTESLFNVGDVLASRIQVSRDQLADWDASARAWLRSADEAKRVQQTQLRLILDNVSLPVSQSSNVLRSIMKATSEALAALENLIQGKALSIQDGAVLLALSSWHLYPDLSVLGETAQYIKMSDSLIRNGGVVTIGMHNHPSDSSSGIYWSLPLAHMKYYGDSVTATRHVGLSESQVTFDQFLCVVLGSLLESWNWVDTDISLPLSVIKEVDKRMGLGSSLETEDLVFPRCLSLLGAVAEYYDTATGVEKQNLSKLVNFGRRKARDLFTRGTHESRHTSPSFFNLTNLNELSKAWRNHFVVLPNGKAAKKTSIVCSFLREWAATIGLREYADDAVVVYLDPHDHFTDLYPYQKRTVDGQFSDGETKFRTWTAGNHITRNVVKRQDPTDVNRRFEAASIDSLPPDPSLYVMLERMLLPPSPGQVPIEYQFLCGDLYNTAIFVPRAKISAVRSKLGWTAEECNLSLENFLLCLKKDVVHRKHALYVLKNLAVGRLGSHIFNLLATLALAKEIYDGLQGSLVDLSVIKELSKSLPKFVEQSEALSRRRVLGPLRISLPIAFSCVIFFETGSINLAPLSLNDAFAISIQNSIYVAESLILDPSVSLRGLRLASIKRITGNLGKPGVAILISPPDPRVRDVEFGKWNTSYEPFDDSLTDNFTGTSCHLSLTGYELPVDTGNRGYRDSECKFVETVISVFDKGKWVADLDISSFTKQKWTRSDQCTTIGVCDKKSHSLEGSSRSDSLNSLLCVDSWTALLDAPRENLIVRAYNNFEARLAATCLAMQKLAGYRVLLLPKTVCWDCAKRDIDCRIRGLDPKHKDIETNLDTIDISIAGLREESLLLIC